MSGNPRGSNVVPMPHAATPASNPSQVPMPFPMWGGGTLPWGPGCCPPGGMDALMKCYCDVQAATAFICSVMVQCIQTNPAVTAAIIAAIEASGSSLPLIGVTNGSDAQPGQVGEFIRFFQSIPITGATQTQQITMGVLQPGDWDVWGFLSTSVFVTDMQFIQTQTPTGFSDVMSAITATSVEVSVSLTSPAVQASISVPSLLTYSVSTNTTGAGGGAGTLDFIITARRMR